MDSLKKWGISGVIVVLFFISTTYLFFHKPSRNWARSKFAIPERKILSVATGRIFPDKKVGKVLKIQIPQGLAIEIYGGQADMPETLIDRFILNDHREAQVQFQARATSLALKDMNGDNIFEIIVPSSDAKLNSHLIVYSYRVETGHFEEFIK